MADGEDMDRVRFGAIVRDRREQLHLAQSALAEHGGPSGVTVRQIENARGDRPSGITLAKLDRALRWTPGSAKRTLAGGEPIVTEENPQPSAETTQAAVGHTGQSPEPYLSRRTGPDLDLTDVTTDALLEELARRARANNPDAHR